MQSRSLARPILLACLVGWFGTPGMALALSDSSQDQPAHQPGTAVSTDPTEPIADKLAGVDAAAENGDLTALHNYLRDIDPPVQAAAFRALAARDPASAVQQLVNVATDMSFGSRWSALALLDGSAEADPHLVVSLLYSAQNDPDPLVSDFAAKAMAALQQPNLPEPPGTEGDLLSSDAAGQTAAFERLSAENPDLALAALIRATRDPRNLAPWHSLQLLDEASSADARTVEAALASALDDPDPLVSDYAFQAMVRRGIATGLDPSVQAFLGGAVPSRASILSTTENSGAGLALLRYALSDPDEQVRSAAAARLKSLAAPDPQLEAASGRR